MNRTRPPIAPPTSDKRWKIVEVTMRRQGFAAHALIEALHAVQDAFGYIDAPSMRYLARSLGLPLSKIYGVATFYHYFTLQPQGKHTCVVCTGTACYIQGVPQLLDAIAERFHVTEGQTTDDQQLSLLSARCVGTCSLAPVVVLDGKVLGHQTSSGLLSRIEEAIGS
jgi:bidirectional [NiFe] hydrogenase diaphorase subunit